MKFFKTGIKDEWHFVVGNGANDSKEFYRELERQLAPQVKALKLKTGYKTVGLLFRRRRMHFAKFGSYMSLTCAEPFGADLNISWYLYYTKAGATGMGQGIMEGITGIFGKRRERVIAFAAVGKDSAERVTKVILKKREGTKEPVASGQLGQA